MNNYLLYRNYPAENYEGVVSSAVPGQSMSLGELVQRFTNGQRLLINSRPIDVHPCDEEGNFIDQNIKDEDERNVMPDIEDRVDLEEYLEEIHDFKEDLKNRSKEDKNKEQKDENVPPVEE